MQSKTSLDRKISVCKEYIKRWEKISDFLLKKYNRKFTSDEEKSEFFREIDWCSKNYSAIKEAESDYIVTWHTGAKTSYPVIWNVLSKFQFMKAVTYEDIEYLKAGYHSLKARLGFLESKKKSIGEIKIEEYEKFKSLIQRLRLEYSMIDSLIELAESCEFLGLGFEWILSTIALQLQEVAMTLVAKQLGIKLDKPSVSRTLGKQFEKDIPFKDRYLAFCREIKRTKDTTLSKLPTDLRGMRTRVLHGGTSPSTSETKLLTDFTCSFLKDLHACMQG